MKPMPIQPSLIVGHGYSIKPIDPGSAFELHAVRIERLTADRELIDRVMWQGYAGPDWERFRRALAEYGVAVLRSWISSGRIFLLCRQKGFGALIRRKRVVDDEAVGLAGETVAVALRFFRDHVLIPGLWDMRKGASLNTFFIGACIRHFPNIYLRSDGAEILKHIARNERDEDLTTISDPSRFARPDERADLVEAFDAVEDPIVREVLLDEALGYTQSETATRLKTTRWAIEGRMRRYRGRRVDATNR